MTSPSPARLAVMELIESLEGHGWGMHGISMKKDGRMIVLTFKGIIEVGGPDDDIPEEIMALCKGGRVLDA